MKIDTSKIMKKAAGASTGLTVAIAFLNLAIIVLKLVKEAAKD